MRRRLPSLRPPALVLRFTPTAQILRLTRIHSPVALALALALANPSRRRSQCPRAAVRLPPPPPPLRPPPSAPPPPLRPPPPPPPSPTKHGKRNPNHRSSPTHTTGIGTGIGIGIVKWIGGSSRLRRSLGGRTFAWRLLDDGEAEDTGAMEEDPTRRVCFSAPVAAESGGLG